MDNDRDISGMRHMWDGTGEWILVRGHENLAEVVIHLSGERLRDLSALRKLLPEYRQMPPAQVSRELACLDVIRLPSMEPESAYTLREHALHYGLATTVTVFCRTSYSPLRREGPGATA